LQSVSQRPDGTDAKVDKFGCLQPPEKMLKLHDASHFGLAPEPSDADC